MVLNDGFLRGKDRPASWRTGIRIEDDEQTKETDEKMRVSRYLVGEKGEEEKAPAGKAKENGERWRRTHTHTRWCRLACPVPFRLLSLES